MVLYGSVDESPLAVKVDLLGYHLVTYAPLKEHIDNVMQVLFTREDLKKV